MISTANITMQFGDKPLFEDISVNFGDGNRYGLIGANGSGKSTFMKILEGSLTPTAGNITVTPNERIGKLNHCLLYTSPSPRDQRGSRMPSSA